ncbi:MAG TPA: hypothetical protein VGQ53_11865 [Chitinophagaceae bacterium]|nr:hypothetical protein [Chitinophagaceae bacterium]
MKKVLMILLITPYSLFIMGQEIPTNTEQQLENLTDADQMETEDDSYVVQLQYFKKHPLNLNEAGANELKELFFLSDLQIESLLSYRRLLGKLISVYELQAIPTWDVGTIKKILPFVTIDKPVSAIEDMKKRFADGDHGLLFRFSEIIETSEGYKETSRGTKYLGSRQRLLFRYRYQYKNLLQYGIVGEKDAGEQFFKGKQKYGFDFYSLHLFATKLGKIQALALGDFTVNMGQGLIQWQSIAFSKSAEVLATKRQLAILRPYNSAGEFYFNRGAGITIRLGTLEATGFISARRLSANFVADTINNEDAISSFLASGYHRTKSEADGKNNMQQFSFGGNFTYRQRSWHIGINGVSYNFSLPVQKRNEPYNLFAISGKEWNNFSVDYSWTYRNLHLFGEIALDKNFDKAILNGLLISVDPHVDLSIVQRTIDQRYQSVYGSAFTENTYPTNENGIYTGISIQPMAGWRLDMYADFYRFPWLRYLVDAPAYGKDFLVQVTFAPNKQLMIYSRCRSESKQSDPAGNATVTNYLVVIPKQSWRTQINYKINSATTLRNRIEMLWFDKNQNDFETGFLIFFDFLYKPLMKSYSGNFRLEYFETAGYNSRIYTYENDVLYSFSIPGFYEKGYRYYFNLNYDVARNLSVWLRWAQTIYKNKTSVGTGSDEIPGNHRSEIKIQMMLLF